MASTKYPQNAPWESRNGYIPPPRFQQLRALDSLQQQQHQFGPPGSGSPQMPPSHSRSPSFFSFFGSKNSTNTQTSVLGRSPSTSSPNPQPVQGYLPPFSSPQNQAQPESTPAVTYNLQHPPQRPSPSVPQQLTLTQLSQQPHPSSVTLSQQQPSQLLRPQHQSDMARAQTPQQVGHTRSPSMQPASQSPESTPNALHPEIRSVVQLTIAHAHKIYFSGPLIRKLERQPDGQKPLKDEGWVDVWAQLGGTTLSIWDMKEIQEASKQGKEVPPSYINVTDAVCIFHH